MSEDTHTCSRCNTVIRPGEIAAKTGSYWLCSSCWKAWSETRAKLVQGALREFVSTGVVVSRETFLLAALDRIEDELDETAPCESSRETRRWMFQRLPCVKSWREGA